MKAILSRFSSKIGTAVAARAADMKSAVQETLAFVAVRAAPTVSGVLLTVAVGIIVRVAGINSGMKVSILKDAVHTAGIRNVIQHAGRSEKVALPCYPLETFSKFLPIICTESCYFL